MKRIKCLSTFKLVRRRKKKTIK